MVIKTKFADSSGFSLPELMIVSAIVVVLAGIGFAGFIAMRPAKNMHADARDLLSNIQQIRLQAVQRNSCVGLEFAMINAPAPARMGYNIFMDDGTGGGTPCNGIREGGETVMRSVKSRPGVVLNAPSTAFPVSSNAFTSISFNQRSLVAGRSRDFPPGTAVGGFFFGHTGRTAPEWLRVVVGLTGNARIERNSDVTNSGGWH